jgi:hypothetical protein
MEIWVWTGNWVFCSGYNIRLHKRGLKRVVSVTFNLCKLQSNEQSCLLNGTLVSE